MPNKPSAEKELRKSKKRAAHNLRLKTHVRTLFKKCVDMINAGKLDEAKKLAIQFQKAVDKAAKISVVSENRSRRKKSALAKMLNVKK